MSRIRSIKPEFFMDDELAELPALARLLFVGLWTQADRAGRLKDKPTRIKAAILPYDECDIEELLQALSDAGFIVRYGVDGSRYIEVVHFDRHQVFNNERASVLPPPNEDYGSDTVALTHGREGLGREGKGTGGDAREEDTDTVPEPPRLANDLPPCLSRLKARDGSTAAIDIRRAFESYFGMTSPADWGEFAAAVRDGCLHGCDGNRAQSVWCAEHIIGNDNYGGKLKQHASPAGFRASRMLLKSMREDRREAPRKEARRA